MNGFSVENIKNLSSATDLGGTGGSSVFPKDMDGSMKKFPEFEGKMPNTSIEKPSPKDFSRQPDIGPTSRKGPDLPKSVPPDILEKGPKRFPDIEVPHDGDLRIDSIDNPDIPKSNEIDFSNSVKDYRSELSNFDEKLLVHNEFFPRTGGSWEGEPGNSIWRPDPNEVPGNRTGGSNPDGLTWGQILKKYGIDGIPFKDGEPDFSEISKGKVEIDDFTDDRASNFDQADEKLAKERGCTPEEVAQWRKEHGYTWHEEKDCKTMQKVPREVHGNIPHEGGIAEYKRTHSDENVA